MNHASKLHGCARFVLWTALCLLLAAPAIARPDRSKAHRGKGRVEGVGVVVASTRNSLTLANGLRLELSHRTRFVNERGEEIPRKRVLLRSNGNERRRGGARGSDSTGLGLVEYEGRKDGRSVRASRVTPLGTQAE